MKETLKSTVRDTTRFSQAFAAFLPAAPALIFVAGMAVEFFHCLVAYNNYYDVIVPVNCLAVLTGLLAIVVRLFGRRSGGALRTAVLNDPTVLWFSAMIILMLFSTLRNGFTVAALYGDAYRCESLFSFIIYLTIYYFATSLLDREQAKRMLMNGFLAVSFLIAVMVLLQLAGTALGISSLDRPTIRMVFAFPTVVGIYHQFNHYGYTLMLAITLSGALFVSAAKVRTRAIYLALFILFTAVLVFNDTFGCHLAVLAALLLLAGIYFVREKKLRRSTLVLLAVFLVVSNTVVPGWGWQNFSLLIGDILRVFGNVRGTVSSTTANRAGSHRWLLWKTTVPMILERPFLGHGVEGIGPRLLEQVGNDRPHNEFLEYAAFFGIPAMLCYLGALAGVWSKFRKRLHTATPCTVAAFTAAFAYVVSSLFGNTMYYTAPLFFIVLGMANAYLPPSDSAAS